MRPTFAFAPDAYDQPPETDPAPVECTECSETECACGDDEPEWCRCARVPGVSHAPKWCAFLRDTDAFDAECEARR